MIIRISTLLATPYLTTTIKLDVLAVVHELHIIFYNIVYRPLCPHKILGLIHQRWWLWQFLAYTLEKLLYLHQTVLVSQFSLHTSPGPQTYHKRATLICAHGSQVKWRLRVTGSTISQLQTYQCRESLPLLSHVPVKQEDCYPVVKYQKIEPEMDENLPIAAKCPPPIIRKEKEYIHHIVHSDVDTV